MLKIPDKHIFAVLFFCSLTKKTTVYQKDFKIVTGSGVELCPQHYFVFSFSQDHTVFPQFYVETSKIKNFRYLYITFDICSLLRKYYITDVYKC